MQVFHTKKEALKYAAKNQRFVFKRSDFEFIVTASAQEVEDLTKSERYEQIYKPSYRVKRYCDHVNILETVCLDCGLLMKGAGDE
jgi:hypothetical protein